MPPPLLHITLHEGLRSPVRYRFQGEAVSIGRSDECDLVIADLELSRVHARISLHADGWELVDLGSRNGTWLNGERISEPARLEDGDEVALGGATLAVRLPGASGSRAGDLSTESRVEPPGGLPVLIGPSAAIAAVRAAVERMAPTAKTVLITGESGTGKELVAELLHARSPRAVGPFVVVNCPALAPSLLEAELFGVEKGVATGVDPRVGRFESARGGTVFLDEVGDMELGAQAKILRALQARTIERIGGRTPIPLDVRVIAATNHDLEADVARGTFRGDLYHRLRVLTVHLPALRERPEDIVPLALHFLAREGRFRLGEDAVAALGARPYPGNVRELEHLIESAVVKAEGAVIEAADLVWDARGGAKDHALPTDVAAELFTRIVERGEPFWQLVREPYLRREISRDAVRVLIGLAYVKGGRTYRGVARVFRLESEYQKLLDFMKNHQLKVRD